MIALVVCALFLFSGLLNSSHGPAVFNDLETQSPEIIGPGNNYGGKPVADRDINVAQLVFETSLPTAPESISDSPPTRDFIALKDEVPVHQEQLQDDGFAYGALFCSRTSNYETDPYYAAIQQQIWRILWSDFASIHPIVIFVCPYVTSEIRNALRGQGALVEEVATVNVPGDHPLNDHYAFLNIFGAVKYRRIAMFDSEAFPIANMDQGSTPKRLLEINTDLKQYLLKLWSRSAATTSLICKMKCYSMSKARRIMIMPWQVTVLSRRAGITQTWDC